MRMALEETATVPEKTPAGFCNQHTLYPVISVLVLSVISHCRFAPSYRGLVHHPDDSNLFS